MVLMAEKCQIGRMCNLTVFIGNWWTFKEPLYLKFWDMNIFYGWGMSQK